LKCEYHPAADAIADCSNCHIPICGICSNYGESDVLCDRCVDVVLTAKLVDEQSSQGEVHKKFRIENDEPAETPHKLTLEESIEKREKWYMAVVILGCLYIGFTLYSTLGPASVLTQQQIAAEEVAIDQLNLCVMVFWEIAEQLQNNQVPDESLACAESSDPNIISRVADDIIVTHPHPELLGYTEIFVRKSNPVPVFIL
jgi:hypothetical protein|tara:strand:+ start:1867 stop:2466 length:600 start_codon:yes stop_codon:yes gene_type:complete